MGVVLFLDPVCEWVGEGGGGVGEKGRGVMVFVLFVCVWLFGFF